MATAADNALSCEELECMEEMDEDGDLLWSACDNVWSDSRESAKMVSRCSSSSGCFSSFHSPESELTLKRAQQDHVICNDHRVLCGLLHLEHKPPVTSHRQEDIKPYMRKMVTNWMLDVCTEQERDEGVFLLSISLLDRFLTCTHIKRTHLQLVAAVCIFIASKSREAFFLSPDKLVAYTAFSITKQDLLEWEMVVLQSLDWDTCDVTSNDFMQPLLRHLPLSLPPSQHHQVIRHAQTFACLAATEHVSSIYSASVLASACLSLSIEHLSPNHSLHLFHQATTINMESIKSCRAEIEGICKATIFSSQSSDVTTSSANKINYLTDPPSPLRMSNEVLEISIV